MISLLPLKFIGYVIFYLVAIWLLANTSDFNLFFSTASIDGFAGIMVFLTWGAEVATAMSFVAVPFLLYWNAQSKKSALVLKGIPPVLLAITKMMSVNFM